MTGNLFQLHIEKIKNLTEIKRKKKKEKKKKKNILKIPSKMELRSPDCIPAEGNLSLTHFVIPQDIFYHV